MGRQLRVLLAVAVPLVALVAAAVWFALADGLHHGGDAEGAAGRGDRPAAPPPAAAAVKRVGTPAKLSGEVRRAGDRRPVAAQRVVLEGVSPKALEVETDARGAFEFADVPHGGPYELVVEAPGCAAVRVPGIELRRGDARDVGTLWLAPAVPVVVEVRSFAGEPIGGATVEAFLVGANAPSFDGPAPAPVQSRTTGVDGAARLEGLAVGTWTFVASKPGFARRGSHEERIEPGDGERRIRLALEHGYRIEGRVLTRSGEPVADATVLSLRRTLTTGAATAPLCSRARSGPDGRYVLESLTGADVCLWAGRPGGRLAIVAAVRPPGVPRLDLVLPDLSYVTGRVTDRAAGTPLGGAAVTASYQILGGIGAEADAVSDETGSFRVALPMRGTLSRLAVAREGYVDSFDAGLERGSIEVPEGATIVRDLGMDRGASLAGVVRAGGEPVAGASVTAYLRNFQESVNTDRDGRYRFDALPRGTALVGATRDGFTQPDFPENPEAVVTGAAPPEESRVEYPAEGAATLDVTLSAGTLALRGVVKDPDGAPVEGARVAVTGDDERAPVVTPSDGSFRIERVVSGAGVGVLVRKQGFAPAQYDFAPQDDPDAPPVEVTLRTSNPPRVTGLVRSATGAPLVDAYVQLGPAGDMGPTDDEWAWLGETRRPVRADGSFEIEVEDGRSAGRVRADAAGLAPSVSETLNFGSDAAVHEVELTLQPGHALGGVVRTARGDPVPGAWVAVFPRSGPDDGSQECNGAWGPALAAVADAAGRFEVRDLAAGWWGVAAWGEDTLRGRAIAEVPRESHVVVEAESALSIDGEAVLADGGPVEGASVIATGPDGGSHHAVTDDAGRFRFGELPPGSYAVLVAPSATCGVNFVATRREDVVAGATGLRIEVPRGLSIAGVVVAGDGSPARGATLTPRIEDTGDDAGVPQSFADAEGRFEIVGLAPGRYSILVSVSDDGDEWSASFGAFPAGAQGVRIELPARLAVEGVLVDDSGAPIGGTAIHATPVREGAAAGADDGELDAETDEEGRFSFRALQTMRYRLQLPDTTGVGLIDAAPVRPGGGPLRLVAGKGASIAGVVVDADGRPVAGVVVTASGDDHRRRGDTAADGTFEVRGLSPGATYVVSAEGGGLIAMDGVEAPAGRRDLKIVAARGLAITGTIEDARGAPLPNCQFRLQAEGGDHSEYWHSTDESGRFRLDGLSPGEWRVTAFVATAGGGQLRPCGTVRSGESDVTLRVEAK